MVKQIGLVVEIEFTLQLPSNTPNFYWPAGNGAGLRIRKSTECPNTLIMIGNQVLRSFHIFDIDPPFPQNWDPVPASRIHVVSNFSESNFGKKTK